MRAKRIASKALSTSIGATKTNISCIKHVSMTKTTYKAPFIPKSAIKTTGIPVRTL